MKCLEFSRTISESNVAGAVINALGASASARVSIHARYGETAP